MKEDKTSGRPAVSVAADVDMAVKNCVLGITVHLLPLNVVIEVAISGLDILAVCHSNQQRCEVSHLKRY